MSRVSVSFPGSVPVTAEPNPLPKKPRKAEKENPDE